MREGEVGEEETTRDIGRTEAKVEGGTKKKKENTEKEK